MQYYVQIYAEPNLSPIQADFCMSINEAQVEFYKECNSFNGVHLNFNEA